MTGLAAAVLICSSATAQDIFGEEDPRRGAPVGQRDYPIDLERARYLYGLCTRLSDADGGAMWGIEIDGPLLFVDRATRAVVANCPDKRGNLEPVADGLWTGRIPDSVNIGNTTAPWAGVQWSMIIWPPPHDDESAGVLMMHERFHSVQPKLGIPLAAPDSAHLDTEEGRVWLRAELRALAAVLESEDPLASPALLDALIFRSHRHTLSRSALKDERGLELNEGLAEYTGLMLGMDDPERRRGRILAALRGSDGTGPFTRMFAYTTGPAWASLLDLAKPGWRSKVRETTTMAKELERATGLRVNARERKTAEARAEKYDIAEIREEERGRAAEREARLAGYRARFVEGPVLSIDMTGSYNYSFSPHGVETLDDIGIVYRTMRLSGPWGILEAPGGALVIEGRRGRRTVVIPAPVDPVSRPVAGDGWTLDIEAGYVLRDGRRRGDYIVTRR